MKRVKNIFLALMMVLLPLGGYATTQGHDVALQALGNTSQYTQEHSQAVQKMVGTTTIDLDSVFQSQQNQNIELIKSEIESVKSEIKDEENGKKLLWQCLISLASSVLVVLVYYLIRRRCSSRSSNIRENEIEELQRQLKDVDIRLNTALTTIHGQVNSSQSKETTSSKNRQQEKKRKKQDSTRLQTGSQQTQPPLHDTSPQQAPEAPANVEYVYLTLSDKQLVPAGMGQTAYYRAWHSHGKIYFAFFCDTTKIMKAINNRDSLIAPCCIKASNSIEPNEATNITTVQPGELDNNYQVINPAIIKYF